MAEATTGLTDEQKFTRRKNSVQLILKLKDDQEVDVGTWQYLQDLLERLGKDGMSSEEEGAKPITDYMLLINQSVAEVKTSKGGSSGPRICVNTNPIGTTAAPPGLPRKMYDEQWLAEREKNAPYWVSTTLRVSEEAFQFLRIPKSVPKAAAAPKSPHENSAASESTPMPTPTWAPPPNIHEAQMGRSKKIQLQFLEPRYINLETPQLIFVPRGFCWSGYFSSLNYKHHTLPILSTNNGFFSLGVIAMWQEIEGTVTRVIHALISFTHRPFPEEMCFYPVPYRFEYEKLTHKTENAARNCAWRSLKAFRPLIAHLAMFLMYMRVDPREDWQEKICEKAKINLATLNELLNSATCREDTQRIGGLLDFSLPPGGDPYDVKLPRALDFMLGTIIQHKLPIPLYISWGPITEPPFVFRVFQARSLSAAGQDRKAVLFKSLRDTPYVPLFEDEPLPTVPSPDVEPLPTAPFPDVEPHSGQHASESMQQFFARRETQNVLREARETPQQRQSRQQRMANAAKGAVPGRKGARIYVWENSSGYLIRTAGGRTRYEELWDEYGPDQRRYNPFRDGWDLCEAFGPAGGDQSDDEGEVIDVDDPGCGFTVGAPDNDDNDDEYKIGPDRPQPLDDDKLRQDVQLPLATPEVLPVGTTTHDNDDIVEFDPIARSFGAMVYLRYGCLAKADISAPQGLDVPQLEIARKLLGNPGLAVNNPKEQLSDIPQSILDLHNPDCDIYCPWDIEVRREILNGKLYYVLYDRSHDGLYVLLESATNALEVVRQGWGPDLASCDSHENAPYAQNDPYRSRIQAQELRSDGARLPDLFGHAGEQFLQSPRGRAAKLYGGIVGRLACTVVSDEEVCRGPTDDVTIDGTCLWDGVSASAYWDDSLTEQEIDLICGVYHISTGQPDPSAFGGVQTTTQSWWPRPSSMAQSGLNVGWWTPMSESWFQRRLRQLDDPPWADLLTSAKWKNNLKLERRCPPLAEAMESVAAQILERFRP
ncbi:hypothetical protein B0H14DRAFT_3452903 [Mycena olivaceomarginata]|nr:hypothetical protein B0H14DRAFT_3452903 [Mycena olivaceomarginata]